MPRNALCYLRLVCVFMLLCSWANATEMVFPGEEWERATPESQSVASDLLRDAVAFLGTALPNGTGTDALFIERNGRVIWEGSGVDQELSVASMTKSFTTTALGLVIDDGEIRLDTPVGNLLPNFARSYPDVTIRHLATMTSNHGMAWGPAGSQFQYYNPTFDAISEVVTKITGQSMDEIFGSRIAEPTGITEFSWGVSGASVDGVQTNQGGSGISISAEDAARFGHLFLNEGNWDGQQLISSDWVSQATALQVGVDVPLNPASDTPWGPGVYGFGWWLNNVQPNGEEFLPGAPPGTYVAAGANNNYVFVVPEWDVVIARTSGGGESFVDLGDWGEFLRLVGLAVDVVSPADANLDGTVDLADFEVLKSNFGISGRAVRGRATGDFDGDEVVGLSDFQILKNDFGLTNAANVPEPTTSLLLLFAVGVLLLRTHFNRRHR